jgi:sec-independent protein translocase protein TatA
MFAYTLASIPLLLGLPGGWEMIVIILLILLFFGAKRIPELARGLGRGMYEFRKAADDIKKEIDSGVKSTDPNSTSNSSKEEEKN